MERIFNVAGPCCPGDHYMISPAERLQGVENLVRTKQYFLIHAARQSGKTTCVQALAHHINAGDAYYAIYCSLETLRDVDTAEVGMSSLLGRLNFILQNTSFPCKDFFAQYLNRPNDPRYILQSALSGYCAAIDRPLVIFFDEVDGLPFPVLIPFITQLRNGYIDRNSGLPFLHSVALVGLRNIRDYRLHIRPETASLGGMSPFNIISEVMTLKNFTREEIAALYGQHTADTGQVFEESAIKHVYEQTLGQPWLVNAIAREVVEKNLACDYGRPVTFALVHEAIQRLIKNRPVHLDNLLERLKEPRVCRVIQPLLLGDNITDRQDDDFQYTKDLGLIQETEKGEVLPGNPIYAEMTVRALSAPTQQGMANPDSPWHMPKYLLPDGGVDMDILLSDFIIFWREHNPAWRDENGDYGIYSEASLVILLCAFLNRLVNGGGEVKREMSAGRGRMDIGVVYNGHRYPIEVKIRRDRDSLATVEAKGREQLCRYMASINADKGWLIIHDRPQDRLTVLPAPFGCFTAPVTGGLLTVVVTKEEGERDIRGSAGNNLRTEEKEKEEKG